MNITATGGAEAEAPHDVAAHGHAQGSLPKLAVGAIGIVFGDIGTSPIYAFRETFSGHHLLRPDQLHIYGVLSLIFWSMMIIVTLKYVTIIMRADNKGEGGSLALLALINRSTSDRKKVAVVKDWGFTAIRPVGQKGGGSGSRPSGWRCWPCSASRG